MRGEREACGVRRREAADHNIGGSCRENNPNNNTIDRVGPQQEHESDWVRGASLVRAGDGTETHNLNREVIKPRLPSSGWKVAHQ